MGTLLCPQLSLMACLAALYRKVQGQEEASCQARRRPPVRPGGGLLSGQEEAARTESLVCHSTVDQGEYVHMVGATNVWAGRTGTNRLHKYISFMGLVTLLSEEHCLARRDSLSSEGV